MDTEKTPSAISSHFQGYTVPEPGQPAEATFQVNIHGAKFTVRVPDVRDFNEAKAVKHIVSTALVSEKKELGEMIESDGNLASFREAWAKWNYSMELAGQLKKHVEGWYEKLEGVPAEGV